MFVCESSNCKSKPVRTTITNYCDSLIIIILYDTYENVSTSVKGLSARF